MGALRNEETRSSFRPRKTQEKYKKEYRRINHQHQHHSSFHYFTTQWCLFGDKVRRDARDGHRTRPDGSDLKWKQIGVKEITDSRELPFFIQWLTEDHPSKDGNAVSKIEKIVIADKDQLAESWFKAEILGALDKVTIDWVDPSANDGDNGIVAVHLSTPNGSVVLD